MKSIVLWMALTNPRIEPPAVGGPLLLHKVGYREHGRLEHDAACRRAVPPDEAVLKNISAMGESVRSMQK